MSMRIPRKRRSEARAVPTPELALLIKKARMKVGLTVREVSDYLDIGPDTLRKYEQECCEIPLSHLYGLSNLLNIPPRQIVELAMLSTPSPRRRA